MAEERWCGKVLVRVKARIKVEEIDVGECKMSEGMVRIKGM